MGRGPWIGAAAEEEEGGPANRDGTILDFLSSYLLLMVSSVGHTQPEARVREPRRPILSRSVLPGTEQRGKEHIIVLEGQMEINQYTRTFSCGSRISVGAPATSASFHIPSACVSAVLRWGFFSSPMPPSHHK